MAHEGDPVLVNSRWCKTSDNAVQVVKRAFCNLLQSSSDPASAKPFNWQQALTGCQDEDEDQIVFMYLRALQK